MEGYVASESRAVEACSGDETAVIGQQVRRQGIEVALVLVLIFAGALFVTVIGLPLPALVTAWSIQLIFLIVVLRLPLIPRPTPPLLSVSG